MTCLATLNDLFTSAKHMSVEQLERYLADMLEEQETRWGYKTHQVDANLRLNKQI